MNMIYNTGHTDRKQSATERPLLCAYSHLEVGYGGRKVKIMTQNVKCGDEVTPLDELSEGSTTEGRICYFKPRFICQSPRMHQDLGENISFFTLRSQDAPLIWRKIRIQANVIQFFHVAWPLCGSYFPISYLVKIKQLHVTTQDDLFSIKTTLSTLPL